MRSLLPLLALTFACSEASVVHTRIDPILGGAADTTSTSVFLLDLRFDTGAAICSAVLVSPRVLLTAAHCVDPAFHSATTVTVKATNKPDTMNLMQSDMIDVTMISRHPGWNPADQQSDFDLAVLLLALAPAGAAPPPLLRALPANPLSQSLTVIGYGRQALDDAASSGTRRTVTVPLDGVGAATLNYGTNAVAGICAGDSGGPSLLGGAVAGIHSRSEGSSCGLGVDIRVDRQLAFIEAFITANDPSSCAADGACAPGCGTTDPDCRTCQADQRCDPTCGLADPDCLDDGAVCTLAAQCAGAQCLDDPRGFQFCSRRCADSSECLNDMTCQSDLCRAPPDTTKGDPVKGGCASTQGLLVWLMVVLMRRRRYTVPA